MIVIIVSKHHHSRKRVYLGTAPVRERGTKERVFRDSACARERHANTPTGSHRQV